MIFSDDDLKRLKDELQDVSNVDLVHFLQDVEALIHRLDAAEHVIDQIGTAMSDPKWDAFAKEKWRKARGSSPRR